MVVFWAVSPSLLKKKIAIKCERKNPFLADAQSRVERIPF
jgi:hypothetical protein